MIAVMIRRVMMIIDGHYDGDNDDADSSDYYDNDDW